jgi:hypothetical protein
MQTDLVVFIAFLSFLWFLAYWVLGGVFFATVTLLHLVHLHKVRFSCLFSLTALVCAIGAAVTGVKFAEDSFATCTPDAAGIEDGFIAALTCGFFGIMGGMLLWAGVLVLAGFVFLFVSRRREKTWLTQFGEKIELGGKNKPMDEEEV